MATDRRHVVAAAAAGISAVLAVYALAVLAFIVRSAEPPTPTAMATHMALSACSLFVGIAYAVVIVKKKLVDDRVTANWVLAVTLGGPFGQLFFLSRHWPRDERVR